MDVDFFSRLLSDFSVRLLSELCKALPNWFVNFKISINCHRIFTEMLNNREKVFIIFGGNGVGKTTLVGKLIEKTREKGILYSSIDFRNPRGSLGEIVKDILESIYCRDPGLFSLIEDISLVEEEIRKRSLEDKLIRELERYVNEKQQKKKKWNMLLFFDSYEHQPFNRNILEQFKLNSETIKITLASTIHIPEYKPHHTVEGINKAIALQIIKDRLKDHSSELKKIILSVTITTDNKYHPLLLGLSICLANKDSDSSAFLITLKNYDIIQKIRKIIVRYLTVIGNERKAILKLALAISFNRTTAQSLNISTVDYDYILCHPFVLQGIATYPSAENYYYHDIVRQVLLEIFRIEDEQGWLKSNNDLIKYYLSKMESHSGTEKDNLQNKVVYHSLCANEEWGLEKFKNVFYDYWKERNIAAARKIITLTKNLKLRENKTVLWLSRARCQLLSEDGGLDPNELGRELNALAGKILSSKSNDKELLALIYLDLARYYVSHSLPEKASCYYKKSINLFESILLISSISEKKDHFTRVLVRAMVSYTRTGSVSLNEKENVLQKGLSYLEKCEKNKETYNTYVFLIGSYARVLRLLCQFPKALELIETYINYAEGREKRGLEELKSRIFADMGLWDEACEIFTKLMVDTEDEEFKYLFLIDLADTERRMGKLGEARTHYNQALGIADKRKISKDKGFCFHGLGMVNFIEKKPCEKLLEHGLEHFTKEQNFRKMADVLADIALMKLDHDFLKHIDSSIDYANKAGATYSLKRCILVKAKGLCLQQNYECALEALRTLNENLTNYELPDIESQGALIRAVINKEPFDTALSLAAKFNPYLYNFLKCELNNEFKRIIW